MSEQRIEYRKPLFGKVVLKGKITCLTGMHIGTSREALEIGGLDAPVLRDPFSGLPYIPGSSLKGKMRSLLERHERKGFNRNVGSPGNPILQHVCDSERKAYDCTVCRIFGSTGHNGGGNFPARLSVRDCEYRETGDENITEVKFENSLDRITAAANPRQIERVTAGAEFGMELVYDVETQTFGEQADFSIDHVERDLANILMLLEMIQDDSIGGHGSRGYGKVEFYIDSFVGYTTTYYGLSDESSDKKNERCGISDPGSIDDCRKKISEIVKLFKKEAEQCSDT
jgi:CRISPR-associated protein Csm3